MKRNTHIEEISEKFSKGNHWCIIIFDCRKGYREAKIELENKKEDHERLQLSIEEPLKTNQKVTSNKELQEVTTSRNNNGKNEEIKKKAEKELEQVFKQRSIKNKSITTNKTEVNQDIRNNQVKETEDSITVWDLP